MKKKLLCLLLCVVMLIAALTACSGETDPTASADSSRKTVTLTMWVICDEPVSTETEKMVEDAFNTITEADYSTHVDFVFCTEDEYETKLEQKYQYIESNRGMGVDQVMLLFVHTMNGFLGFVLRTPVGLEMLCQLFFNVFIQLIAAFLS